MRSIGMYIAPRWNGMTYNRYAGEDWIKQAAKYATVDPFFFVLQDAGDDEAVVVFSNVYYIGGTQLRMFSLILRIVGKSRFGALLLQLMGLRKKSAKIVYFCYFDSCMFAYTVCEKNNDSLQFRGLFEKHRLIGLCVRYLFREK